MVTLSSLHTLESVPPCMHAVGSFSRHGAVHFTDFALSFSFLLLTRYSSTGTIHDLSMPSIFIHCHRRHCYVPLSSCVLFVRVPFLHRYNLQSRQAGSRRATGDSKLHTFQAFNAAAILTLLLPSQQESSRQPLTECTLVAHASRTTTKTAQARHT
jgi:hypothetical protein